MKENSASILVIGGGVSGLETARDLSQRGYKVFLVEKATYLGGKIMQLDETFPVNAVSESCSLCYPLCYMLPEISKIYLEEGLEIFTYSVVESIKKSRKKYDVTINKKARFVDPELCNGCGACVKECPVKDISNEFDYGLSNRTAIFQPLTGSVNPQHIIDSSNCLHFKDKSCNKCAEICPKDAIDFKQKDEKIKLSVDAIVVATGYEQINPGILPQFGFEFDNVLSSMQFERMNSINGPTGGKVLRPSDKKEPKSIAFIQCVGSRNNGSPGCVSYCSTVCCMYSSKEALNIRRKKIPDCECFIFNTEKRGYGKQYYDMMLDAQNQWGVNYINGRISFVEENPEKQTLVIKYEDLNSGKFSRKEVDLIVLAAALTETKGKRQIAEMVGSKLDSDGLFNKEEVNQLEEKNVFITGFARFPMNIPDSVTDGSAVASKIAQKFPLPLNRWTPDEIEEESEEVLSESEPLQPRIGIFYCEFYDKISDILNFEKIVKAIQSSDDVLVQEIVKDADSLSSRNKMQKIIKKSNLNRVIFTSGSPRYYENYFTSLLKEIDFNLGLFEIIDLREQNAYIHKKNKKMAQEKAVDLIRMNIAKIRTYSPIETVKGGIIQKALVLGNDASSIITASALANQNIPVYHVHSEPLKYYDAVD
ncbi:MAG: FAD-dependent oxidoreductase, partial [Candidatus Lokiarchaeota archaeon]|nr:FAD-dependent oxidoreductase [Candidatus Lokiarchaeota archaeon]